MASPNSNYVLFGRYAVHKYAEFSGNVDEPETVLADLLADLQHYADDAGLDFDAALTRAINHYNEEVS